MLPQMILFPSFYTFFLIRSSVSGHSSCFYVLATVSTAAMNNVFFELWFSTNIWPGMGLQCNMVVLLLVF